MRNFEFEVLLFKSRFQLFEHDVDDLVHVLSCERSEQHGIVKSVEKLGAEGLFEQSVDLLFCFFFDVAVLVDVVKNHVAAEVGSQDDDCILEVDGSALAVGDSAVVEHLKKDVENVGMCLFDFVEQHDGVGFSSHGFGELTAFVVSYVSRRRTYKTRYAEFFHVLRHIDTHDVALVVKQIGSKRFCKFRLADAGRAEEEERTDRSVFVGYACTRTQHRFADRLHRFVLSDNSLVKLVGKVKQFLLFAFHKFGYGDTRPFCHDFCDFVRSHFVTKKGRAVCGFLFSLFEFLGEGRQFAVLKLCRLAVVAVALCFFDLKIYAVNLGFGVLNAVDFLLLVFPLRFHFVEFVVEFGKFLFDGFATVDRKFVGFFFKSHFLDFELHDFTADNVHFGWHAVDFGTNHRARFVHEVDCFVGEESVGDISVR